MFDGIRELWGGLKATKQFYSDDTMIMVASHIATTLKDNSQGLGKHMSQERKDKTFSTFCEIVAEARFSDNPRMAIRHQIEHWGGLFARNEVMLLGEDAGWKSLLKFDGISGQLRCHADELARLDENLADLTKEFRIGQEPADAADYRNQFLWTSWEMHLLLQALYMARAMLGDIPTDPNMDWYKPSLVSMCIASENYYRNLLGLELAYPNEDGLALKKIEAHSLFFRFLQGTSPNPRQEWEDLWRKSFNEDSPYLAIDWRMI